MKTIFFLKNCKKFKWFLIDCTNRKLGNLAVITSTILLNKNMHSNKITKIIIINTNKIEVSGKKESKKVYYKFTDRPGNLKKDTFLKLKKKNSNKIVEKAIIGMLPKTRIRQILSKNIYFFHNAFYLYNKFDITDIKNKDVTKI